MMVDDPKFGRHGDVVLVREGDEPPERGESLDGWIAAVHIRDHVRRDPRHVLESALTGGVVRAYRRRRLDAVRPPQPVDEMPIASAPAPSPRDVSWIEIELVDMADQPVGGERYELTLPDGSVVRGTSTVEGVVRIPSDDEGDCALCFVDLDGEAWEPT